MRAGAMPRGPEGAIRARSLCTGELGETMVLRCAGEGVRPLPSISRYFVKLPQSTAGMFKPALGQIPIEKQCSSPSFACRIIQCTSQVGFLPVFLLHILQK